jgi:hypothetical protein
VGGVCGNLPDGGGMKRVSPSLFVVGITFTDDNRGEEYTVWICAGFVSIVEKPVLLF